MSHPTPIAFVGDVHGKFREFLELLAEIPPGLPVVQLGDFGLWPRALTRSEDLPPLPRPVHVIWGNHDYYPRVTGLTAPTEIVPNLIYVPRGCVLDLGGHRVGFLGGGDSIDRAIRVEGVDWFPEERITYVDVLRFADVDHVDILATHVPPRAIVRHVFGLEGSSSDQAVEQVWEGLGRPTLVCGHMHEARHVPGVHVLPELGLLVLEHVARPRP